MIGKTNAPPEGASGAMCDLDFGVTTQWIIGFSADRPHALKSTAATFQMNDQMSHCYIIT
jgi:hypothetical protein